MTKLQQLKHAMKNPPPERLAKVEYRSHLMQGLGVTVVCIILITKGLWYIIFAFVFSLGISYSQGMTAYARYKAILSLTAPEKLEDYDKDISPTRRRSKIINSVIPNAKWFSITISVVGSMFILGIGETRWLMMLTYPTTIAASFIVVHFFIMYWVCYPFYKRKIRMKGSEKK